jgi:hypothetical protein
MKFQAQAGWKRLASVFRSDWKIEDYPIYTRFHGAAEGLRASRLKPIPWSAAIINWPAMNAGGATELEAREDLCKKFQQFKSTQKALPRPGTKVPLQFTATTRVDQHAALAEDFIRRVLGLEWAWISDQSSLGDFHEGETNETLLERIRSRYGVDVSDTSDGNLAAIFDRIAGKSNGRPS